MEKTTTTVRNKNRFYKISQEQYKKDNVNEYCNYDEIRLPSRATTGSAGYDFYALSDFTIMPGQSKVMPTGIKVSLNNNSVLLCFPRSSLGFKYKLKLDNTIGVIDSDYYNNENNEGHIWVSLTNMSPDRIVTVKKGDAYMQGIIINFEKTVDDNVKTNRKGGFGSTNTQTNKKE